MRKMALYGLGALAGIVLVILGIMQMRRNGVDSSPWLVLGMFPALICPALFGYYLHMLRVFRRLRSGDGVIARWTVPADEMAAFNAREREIPVRSILANYYQPPASPQSPEVEVIFSDRGVLIAGGYFPLSVHGGRQVQEVRYVAEHPPAIEFSLSLQTSARTSRFTTESRNNQLLLRVPVALHARREAGEVIGRYQSFIDAAAGSRSVTG